MLARVDSEHIEVGLILITEGKVVNGDTFVAQGSGGASGPAIKRSSRWIFAFGAPSTTLYPAVTEPE